MALKIILASVAAGLFVGCTTPAAPPAGTGSAPAEPVTGVCNAQGAQFAVGRAGSANVVEEARQRSGSYMARVLRPNQAVTLEFNAQRLNLELDSTGVIRRARCG